MIAFIGFYFSHDKNIHNNTGYHDSIISFLNKIDNVYFVMEKDTYDSIQDKIKNIDNN